MTIESFSGGCKRTAIVTLDLPAGYVRPAAAPKSEREQRRLARYRWCLTCQSGAAFYPAKAAEKAR